MEVIMKIRIKNLYIIIFMLSLTLLALSTEYQHNYGKRSFSKSPLITKIGSDKSDGIYDYVSISDIDQMDNTYATTFETKDAPSVNWLNSNYLYRKKITITNNYGSNVVTNTIVKFIEDTETLISDNKVRSDGNDWRIAYWTGSAWTELARDVHSGWNSANTETWFRLQADISNIASDDNYYVYYGYSGETGTPTTLGLSEYTIQEQTTHDGQTDWAIDWDNLEEWGAGQAFSRNYNYDSWGAIKEVEMYCNDKIGSTADLLAAYIFSSASGDHGDEVPNGISNTKQNTDFVSPSWNTFTFSPPYPRVEPGRNYFAILPYNNRDASTQYIRWDYDADANGEQAYQVWQGGSWGSDPSFPSGAEYTHRVTGHAGPNDDCSHSLSSEEKTIILLRKFDNAIFNAWSSSVPPYKCTLSVKTEANQQDIIIEWDKVPSFDGAYYDDTAHTLINPGGIDTVIITLGSTPEDAETLFYWRAKVYNGYEWSSWSDIRSFTMDMEAEDVYWYQVGGAQFEQDTLNNTTVQGDSVILSTGETIGSLTSLHIIYNDLKAENSNRNDWDGVKWVKSEKDDSIGIQVEYKNAGVWTLVPDDVIGTTQGLNSFGFYDQDTNFCTVDLTNIGNPESTEYDTLRIKVRFKSYSVKSANDPTLKMLALGNTSGNITGVPNNDKLLIFALNRVIPNPFINRTNIKYQIPKKVKVNLQVLDIVGRSVVNLVNKTQNPGYYSLQWNGNDKNNRELPSGIYFLRMDADGFQSTQKMLFLR
jgi:hypothetical protein